MRECHYSRILLNCGLPLARVVLTVNGPRYTCTRERLSGVTTKALLMNLGHPWGWLTVQHLTTTSDG